MDHVFNIEVPRFQSCKFRWIRGERNEMMLGVRIEEYVNGRKTTHDRRVHVEHLKGHSLRNMRCCTLRERIQSKLTKLYSIGIHFHLPISTL